MVDRCWADCRGRCRRWERISEAIYSELRQCIPLGLLFAMGIGTPRLLAADDGVAIGGQMNVQADAAPTQPNAGTTLASTLNALLATVGHGEWSMARLQGVMGHAFQFQMAPDGGGHMHDNLDWGIALEALPKIGQFRSFEAIKGDSIDLAALKSDARDAARRSLLRAVPALVWQPMSRVQQADKGDPAHHAYCWGLVVGYNEGDHTYTIRHPFVTGAYTVRYDSIGFSDGAEWFNLKVWEGEGESSLGDTHWQALRHAVAFAYGTRFTNELFVRDDGRQVRPYGFAAYETWLNAFESPDVSAHHTEHHAHMLRYRRTAAALYVRELTDVFPVAAAPLQAAAVHYEHELESVQHLFDLSRAASARGFNAADRKEAQRLIRAALAADRAAVEQIELALARLDK